MTRGKRTEFESLVESERKGIKEDALEAHYLFQDRKSRDKKLIKRTDYAISAWLLSSCVDAIGIHGAIVGGSFFVCFRCAK